MHKLNRGPAPESLQNYRHGRDNWSDVTPDEKLEIWNQLEAMQGQRCAYCEDAISNHHRHIEHFRQRSRYPQGTFSWDNLFGSCDRLNNCGRHKDRCGNYDHLDLIKPDVEDPEKFFLFITDGTIRIRPELNPNNTRRASETLRIFNLNARSGSLRYMRERAVIGYKQIAEELRQLAEIFPLEDFQAYLQTEITATAQLPFATAIKHALSSGI